MFDIDTINQTKKQLETIDQSLDYLLLIMAGLFLSYYGVRIQKEQLLCSICEQWECQCLPNVFSIKLISSMLIFAALIFFFQTSKKNEKCSLNYIASLLVLAAGVLRFADLAKAE